MGPGKAIKRRPRVQSKIMHGTGCSDDDLEKGQREWSNYSKVAAPHVVVPGELKCTE